jgi:hypothetical protein
LAAKRYLKSKRVGARVGPSHLLAPTIAMISLTG